MRRIYLTTSQEIQAKQFRLGLDLCHPCTLTYEQMSYVWYLKSDYGPILPPACERSISFVNILSWYLQTNLPTIA